jgi:hypothetical protein
MALRRSLGGGSGIRTRDTVSRIHTFQACAFNHSATPPRSAFAGPAGRLNPPAMRISAKSAHYSAASRQRKRAPVVMRKLMKVEKARSAKPCDGLTRTAEDEEINLVRLQDTFAGRVEISAEIPRDSS